MTTGNTPREDAEFEAFLGRESPVSADYAGLEKVGPPASLDEKILAVAKVAAKPVPKLVPKPEAESIVTLVTGKAAPTQPAAPAAPTPTAAERRKRVRPPAPGADDEDDALPARRPPWLVPAALAASVLVAVGVGLGVSMNSPSDSADETLDGALFAKRARERREESKVAPAASAGQDAEVIELEPAPLPPPPFFELEGSQVQDLDAAIALIRKELVLANQVAAAQEDQALEVQSLSSARTPGQQAAAPATEAEAAAPAASSVVQPRERRLTKILELYDGGNPELAGDSLEIFLRDFEDDPISKRIVAPTPN